MLPLSGVAANPGAAETEVTVTRVERNGGREIRHAKRTRKLTQHKKNENDAAAARATLGVGGRGLRREGARRSRRRCRTGRLVRKSKNFSVSKW